MNMGQTTTDSMICTSCRKQKAELRARKSKLITNMQMFLCNECFKGKNEPRFAIIMVGRQRLAAGDDLGPVEEYLRLHRYVGEEILASDLV